MSEINIIRFTIDWRTDQEQEVAKELQERFSRRDLSPKIKEILS